ncbi:MAG: plastocyanin/azurin family copper-binding protein [Actinomycetota bacterium]|nr:plastocyanin/azurin family copper-binding protein [Actinomycetota bacterium]
MKRILLAALLAASLGAACADDTTSTGSSADAPTDVALEAIEFQPQKVEVSVGTTVRWTNEDEGVAHTVTSGKPKEQGIPGLSEDKEGRPDGVFNEELNDAGDTFEFTFDKPGTYTYFCAIHAPMTGTVVVE